LQATTQQQRTAINLKRQELTREEMNTFPDGVRAFKSVGKA
jgi:hypothetical protein